MSATCDSEVLVSFEDQQKINQFARHNSKHEDLSDELKAKDNELQALEDAENELLLAVDIDKVPFQLGDGYIYVTSDEAQQMLDSKKEDLKTEQAELREQQANLKKLMSDLKIQLYAKFGNNINLEAE